jgi:predicted lysophospholipase L1 biosynthesis ABC-type transport system permease subunit
VVQESGDPTLAAEDIAAMSDAELLNRLVEPLAPHMVVFDAGGPEEAAAKAIAASNGSLSRRDFAQQPTPEAVINLDLSQASRIPDTFSGLMFVVAIAVVAMLVASGGRRRRQDLAILRALGFGPRHVRRVLIAQAVTTTLAASLLVPVGVALGRVAWVGYANGLGVVPEPLVSPGLLAAALGSLLAISLAVALITARFQVRVPLAAALRPRE